jgi:peptidylprolyl isomerase
VPKGAAPSHLVSKDLVQGTGQRAQASSTVTVNYVGVLYKNGKEFDSSWSRGQPATFSLSGLIKGWSEGMVGMRVGGRRELIIPPNLGYGSRSRSSIPANSTLVFVVDLLSVA